MVTHKYPITIHTLSPPADISVIRLFVYPYLLRRFSWTRKALVGVAPHKYKFNTGQTLAWQQHVDENNHIDQVIRYGDMKCIKL